MNYTKLLVRTKTENDTKNIDKIENNINVLDPFNLSFLVLLSLYLKFMKKMKRHFVQNILIKVCNIDAMLVIVLDDPIMIGCLHCTKAVKYISVNL